MKIFEIKENALYHSLISLNRKIVISYKSKDIALRALEGLDIEIDDNLYVNEKNKTISLTPRPQSFKSSYRLTNDNEHSIEVIIPDFKSSEEFYLIAKRKKASYKILRDKFSSQRGAMLFEHLERIETDFREWYLKNADERFDLNASKSPDHPINQFTLSDMVFKKLLSPCSDEYFLERLKASKNNLDVLNSRKLTKIDELGMPFTKFELEKFVASRNSIMHFKVVTKSDAENIIKLLDKLHAYNFDKLINEITEARLSASTEDNAVSS